MARRKVTSRERDDREKYAFTRLKTAVLAPIPRARDRAAIAVKAGLRTSPRVD
jgi:hypothetical protein